MRASAAIAMLESGDCGHCPDVLQAVICPSCATQAAAVIRRLVAPESDLVDIFSGGPQLVTGCPQYRCKECGVRHSPALTCNGKPYNPAI